jgi:hydrogenase maturation protease
VTPPTLIFTWGNPSRGDDALGPLFAERIAAMIASHPQWGSIECLTDFQLQVEHALDLQGRSRVLFVDASLAPMAPFTVTRIEAMRDLSFTSHAMTPQAVLQVYTELHDEPPPPAWLLGIRGVRFELGEDLSDDARAHLDAALTWTTEWLSDNSAERYNAQRQSPFSHCESPP